MHLAQFNHLDQLVTPNRMHCRKSADFLRKLAFSAGQKTFNNLFTDESPRQLLGYGRRRPSATGWPSGQCRAELRPRPMGAAVNDHHSRTCSLLRTTGLLSATSAS